MKSTGMDRFEYGLPDPQEAKALRHCDECGAEIYAGETVWVHGSERFCTNECLFDFIGAFTVTAGD